MDTKRIDLLAESYEDLNKGLKRINRGVIAAVFFVEILYMILYVVTGRITIPLFHHFLYYVVRPVILMILVYLLGEEYFLKKEVTIGFCGICTMMCLFCIVSMVHFVFPVLYLTMSIPVVFSIIFNNPKLTAKLYFISQFLGTLCFVTSIFDKISIKPDRYIYNIIIFYCVSLFIYMFSKVLIVYEDKMVSIVERYRKDLVNKIKEYSYDPLTKVHTHENLLKVTEEWVNSGECICYAIIDIDHFKNVNDTYGHEFGNVVLERLGRLLNWISVDDSVFVARYGGEEFSILFKGVRLKNAYFRVDKLRRQFREEEFRETREHFTFSGGICELKDEMSVKELFEKADNLLYKSKSEGRNRISM